MWICTTFLILGLPAVSVAQGACVPCDELKEKLQVVQGKYTALGEGLEMLKQAGEELRSDESVADVSAAVYGVLGGTNIVLGVATLPCDIGSAWLEALMGGASGLEALVQGGDADDVTLAVLVSYVGLGVVSDSLSFKDFWEEYWKGKEDVSRLERDLEKSTNTMRAIRDKLRAERSSLKSLMEQGECEGASDELDDILNSETNATEIEP